MANLTFNPSDHNSDKPYYTVGTRIAGPGDVEYEYVKVVDLDLAVGDVVLRTATSGTVTKDYTGGTAHLGLCAGVALGTVTAGNYGVIQRRGACATVKCASTVVAGDLLAAPDATDGRASEPVCTGAAGATLGAQVIDAIKRLGVATGTAASNVCSAYLSCL